MFFGKKVFVAGSLVLAGLISHVAAAAFPKEDSVIQYWGQNSVGKAESQNNLAHYCDDHTDVFIISFIVEFNIGGLPTLNLANACVDTFNGTTLLKCDKIGADIKTCQSKGKKILVSLGGASGSYGFRNDDDAKKFAHTLWDLFGAGSSNTRPFGDAVIDGFDLDIEGGGSSGYAALVTELRSLFAKDASKDYYITAAPQCVYPDAMLSKVIDTVGMDAIIVQFYNNYCAATTSSFNFDTWDNWAKKTSPNKDVKVFLGVPGSQSAAGSGYVPFNKLEPIVKQVKSTYSSYGGVAMWDASQSYKNTVPLPHYAAAVGKLVHTASPSRDTTNTSETTTPTTPTSSALPSPTSIPTPPSCVTHGSTCSTEGQYVCTGADYAVCNHGQWVVQKCAADLACMSSTDGASIYCAQASSTPESCSSAKPGILSSSYFSVPKAYTSMNTNVTAQLSVTDVTGSSYDAIINARRTNLVPFGRQVALQITLPPNITVTGVSSGTVKQSGRVASLNIRNKNAHSMSLVFSIHGKVASGSVFRAPDVKNMKFMS